MNNRIVKLDCDKIVFVFFKPRSQREYIEPRSIYDPFYFVVDMFIPKWFIQRISGFACIPVFREYNLIFLGKNCIIGSLYLSVSQSETIPIQEIRKIRVLQQRKPQTV